MAKLPETFVESPTVLAIYEAYKKADKPRFSRRLGASVLGNECPRAVWYSFRWTAREEFDGRKLRLFETGTLAESRFINNLKAIGCEVIDRDPDTGNQLEYTSVGGHLVVKLDAAVLGIPEAPKTWHAAEFKTHNNKSFNDLRKNGLRDAKPQHFAQLATGMVLSGMDRGLYMAVNKDTDELYAERVRMDESLPLIVAFAEKIIGSTQAPARISDDADKIPCRWCTFKSVCFGDPAPAPAVAAIISCRTCCHATPQTDGTIGNWKCERHKRSLSEAEQLRACEDHLFIPDFITFGTPTDGGEAAGVGYVEYTNASGKTWRNGKGDGMYRSLELTQLPAVLIADDAMVAAAKQELGAVAVGEVA